MIADSHCHLTLFPKDEVDQIIKNSLDNGVSILHTISTSLGEHNDLVEICEKYENIYCSVGIHPNNVVEKDIGCAEKIVKLSKHKKVISIGETGLDYHHQSTEGKLQQQIFQRAYSSCYN